MRCVGEPWVCEPPHCIRKPVTRLDFRSNRNTPSHVYAVAVTLVAVNGLMRRRREPDLRHRTLKMAHVPPAELTGVVTDGLSVWSWRRQEQPSRLQTSTRQDIGSRLDRNRFAIQRLGLQPRDGLPSVLRDHTRAGEP